MQNTTITTATDSGRAPRRAQSCQFVRVPSPREIARAGTTRGESRHDAVRGDGRFHRLSPFVRYSRNVRIRAHINNQRNVLYENAPGTCPTIIHDAIKAAISNIVRTTRGFSCDSCGAKAAGSNPSAKRPRFCNKKTISVTRRAQRADWNIITGETKRV